MIDKVCYTNPKPHQEWFVIKSDFEDLDELYKEDAMLQGALHSKGTRCTVISQSKMKWLTYFLAPVDENGVKSLKEIPDSQKT